MSVTWPSQPSNTPANQPLVRQKFIFRNDHQAVGTVITPSNAIDKIHFTCWRWSQRKWDFILIKNACYWIDWERKQKVWHCEFDVGAPPARRNSISFRVAISTIEIWPGLGWVSWLIDVNTICRPSLRCLITAGETADFSSKQRLSGSSKVD